MQILFQNFIQSSPQVCGYNWTNLECFHERHGDFSKANQEKQLEMIARAKYGQKTPAAESADYQLLDFKEIIDII